MSFEPVFESIKYNGKKIEKSQQIKVECKTEIPAESVAKVLGVFSRADITRSEKELSKVSFGGKATFYICYENAEGKLTKCECGSEFVGDFQQENIENYSFNFKAVTEKVQADVTGIKLMAFCYVTIYINLTPIIQTKALTGGENLICDSGEVVVNYGLGKKVTIYPIEEEFELNYQVAEVLNHRAEGIVTAVQCGVGCIIVDGEVFLSAILLQSGEKQDIIRENRTIPFRVEIDCEEAMPSLNATAYVKEKSFKTDISVDEEKACSLVTAYISLQFEGEAFASSNVNICNDAFNLLENVKVVYEQAETYNQSQLFSDTFDVVSRASTFDLPLGSSVIAVLNERIEVVDVKEVEESFIITTMLVLDVLFMDNEGKYFTRILETSLEKTIEKIDENSIKEIKICAQKGLARIVSLSEIEVSAQITLSIYLEKLNTIKFIKEISSTGEKPINSNAISVYIPTEGEELWGLAKRLNVSPETLIETNSDLQFPLTGKERIVVYRKL